MRARMAHRAEELALGFQRRSQDPRHFRGWSETRCTLRFLPGPFSSVAGRISAGAELRETDLDRCQGRRWSRGNCRRRRKGFDLQPDAGLRRSRLRSLPVLGPILVFVLVLLRVSLSVLDTSPGIDFIPIFLALLLLVFLLFLFLVLLF